ncbi:hypothetical protein B0H16DRAFT_331272 [Mycena metata]|uniref:Uncharacterized protein n=1 Tax=Mycena metata TaxID=1033252 RepID=A0AAD7MMS4_9AGAR|nr:hypothetical protein B0H16DRAFT_331272 [Mycena metata]
MRYIPLARRLLGRRPRSWWMFDSSVLLWRYILSVHAALESYDVPYGSCPNGLNAEGQYFPTGPVKNLSKVRRHDGKEDAERIPERAAAFLIVCCDVVEGPAGYREVLRVGKHGASIPDHDN